MLHKKLIIFSICSFRLCHSQMISLNILWSQTVCSHLLLDTEKMTGSAVHVKGVSICILCRRPLSWETLGVIFLSSTHQISGLKSTHAPAWWEKVAGDFNLHFKFSFNNFHQEIFFYSSALWKTNFAFSLQGRSWIREGTWVSNFLFFPVFIFNLTFLLYFSITI